MSFSIKPLNQNLNSYYFQAEKKPASLADQARNKSDESDENDKPDEFSKNMETAKRATPEEEGMMNMKKLYNSYLTSIALDTIIHNKELYFSELDES